MGRLESLASLILVLKAESQSKPPGAAGAALGDAEDRESRGRCKLASLADLRMLPRPLSGFESRNKREGSSSTTLRMCCCAVSISVSLLRFTSWNVLETVWSGKLSLLMLRASFWSLSWDCSSHGEFTGGVLEESTRAAMAGRAWQQTQCKSRLEQEKRYLRNPGGPFPINSRLLALSNLKRD